MNSTELGLAQRLVYKFLDTKTKLKHYQQVVDLFPVVAFILDPQSLRLIFCNRMSREVFKLPENCESRGLCWFDFLREDRRTEIKKRLLNFMGSASDGMTFVLEHEYVLPESINGTHEHLFLTYLTRMEGNGIVGYSFPKVCKDKFECALKPLCFYGRELARV